MITCEVRDRGNSTATYRPFKAAVVPDAGAIIIAYNDSYKGYEVMDVKSVVYETGEPPRIFASHRSLDVAAYR